MIKHQPTYLAQAKPKQHQLSPTQHVNPRHQSYALKIQQIPKTKHIFQPLQTTKTAAANQKHATTIPCALPRILSTLGCHQGR